MRDAMKASEIFNAGFAEGLNPPPSKVPPERVETLRRLYRLARRLKKMERCSASSIEGRPCIIRDVRWSGRELTRLLDEMATKEERDAVASAELRDMFKDFEKASES